MLAQQFSVNLYQLALTLGTGCLRLKPATRTEKKTHTTNNMKEQLHVFCLAGSLIQIVCVVVEDGPRGNRIILWFVLEDLVSIS